MSLGTDGDRQVVMRQEIKGGDHSDSTSPSLQTSLILKSLSYGIMKKEDKKKKKHVIDNNRLFVGDCVYIVFQYDYIGIIQ